VKESRKSSGEAGRGQSQKSGASSPRKVTDGGSSIEQKSAAAAADQPVAVTFHCYKCATDFKFSSKKTASASFGNHLRKCDPERLEAMKSKKSRKKKSPAKVRVQGRPRRNSIPQKEQKNVGHGNSGFGPNRLSKEEHTVGQNTEVKKSTPNELTTMPIPEPDEISLKKRTANSDSAPITGNIASSKPTPNDSSTKSAPGSNYNAFNKPVPVPAKKDDVSKKPPPMPILKPIIASNPEHATPKPPPAQSSASSGKTHNDDVILSLKCPRYKQVMFAKFQMLGTRRGGEENKRLDDMKYELFSFFKQKMGDDGKFLKSDRRMNDTWEVDDNDALEKIKMDLKRRNESSKHWLKD